MGQKLPSFVEDTMQRFPNFILPLLWHPRQNIPNTMDGAALPWDFILDVIYRFKHPLVTISNDNPERF